MIKIQVISYNGFLGVYLPLYVKPTGVDLSRPEFERNKKFRPPVLNLFPRLLVYRKYLK